MHTIHNEFRPLKLEEKFIHILTISLEAFPTRKKATDHVQKIREQENNQKCVQILQKSAHKRETEMVRVCVFDPKII